MDLNRDSFRTADTRFSSTQTRTRSLCYDKAQDLKKPAKRAMDKDQNSLQTSLFDVLVKRNKKEILRIEARLAKRVKLNATLKNLGYKENPTFRDVFRKTLCQKVLQNYWTELIANKNLFVFDVETNPKKRPLSACSKNKPSIKPKDAIYLVGLQVLSNESIRDARAIVERHATTRTRYRIAEDLDFPNRISAKSYHGWVKQVADALEEFVPYKLSTGPVAL